MICKLGGEPWAVDIPMKGTMVIGYDTYHDSAQKGRSAGALVASLNKTFTKYLSVANLHTNPAQELTISAQPLPGRCASTTTSMARCPSASFSTGDDFEVCYNYWCCAGMEWVMARSTMCWSTRSRPSRSASRPPASTRLTSSSPTSLSARGSILGSSGKDWLGLCLQLELQLMKR